MAVYELTVSDGRRVRIRRNGRGQWYVHLSSLSVPAAWLRFKTLTDASKAARLALAAFDAPVIQNGG